ncbi:MAG: sigma-70 family RNA polymerase sigma factor [Spirochaetales bacterium]|nr:sigma-70 family RNA polymerase sigma factor [Spirochaetales bacterium]
MTGVAEFQRCSVKEDKFTERTGLNLEEKDVLSEYLKEISAYPLLTKDEEMEIGRSMWSMMQQEEEIKQLYQDGKISHRIHEKSRKALCAEKDALQHRMITSNLRLVVSIAKKFQRRGLSLLDLINEGNIGLIEAVKRYDYHKGCKFSTYGTWWIQQAIVKALADKGRSIRVPVHMHNLARKCYSVSKNLAQEYQRTPSYKEIGGYLHLSEDKVERVMEFDGNTTSLDITVDDEQITNLSDLVVAEQYRDPLEEVFVMSLSDILDKALSRLESREKAIIILRYGLGNNAPLTLEEIGEKIGITRERVRQIQNNAIAKLRRFDIIQELQMVM